MRIYSNIAFIYFTVLMLSLLGENPTSARVKQNSVADGRIWAGLDLTACVLNLKSKDEVRWLAFKGNGYLSVTSGVKAGPITAGISRWRKKGEWLQIFEEDGQFVYQMRALKISANEISVEDGHGKTEVYEIQHNEKPASGTVPDVKKTKPQ